MQYAAEHRAAAGPGKAGRSPIYPTRGALGALSCSATRRFRDFELQQLEADGHLTTFWRISQDSKCTSKIPRPASLRDLREYVASVADSRFAKKAGQAHGSGGSGCHRRKPQPARNGPPRLPSERRDSNGDLGRTAGTMLRDEGLRDHLIRPRTLLHHHTQRCQRQLASSQPQASLSHLLRDRAASVDRSPH